MFRLLTLEFRVWGVVLSWLVLLEVVNGPSSLLDAWPAGSLISQAHIAAEGQAYTTLMTNQKSTQCPSAK